MPEDAPRSKDTADVQLETSPLSRAVEDLSGEEPTLLVDLEPPLGPILRDAVAQGATDVHLDPVEDGKRVRLRVNGLLREREVVPLDACERLLNLIKVAAELRTDRVFHPLEGRFTVVEDETEHDIRVSILPVRFPREAVHLRFLSAGPQMFTLEEIGLQDEDAALLRQSLEVPAGLYVISGDTGSGKSTSLYALANALPQDELVVASIEDPVELHLPGVRQVQADPAHDFTIHEGLRTLLRTDPDVICVGEVRDAGSAVAAARAAMTGHLVLATVHAPTCAVAVEALRHLEAPQYVLSAALRMLVNQHLLRRLNPDVCVAAEPDDAARELFDAWDVPVPETVCRAPSGGEAVQNAYAGRIGVFEIVPVDSESAHAIGEGAGRKDLEKRFRENGRPLLADALRKAADGIVSIDEVMLLARYVESL